MPHSTHNYSTLKKDIKLWTARNDTDFVAALPEFIHMTEQRIAYGSAAPLQSDPVRVRDMQKTVQITVTNGIGPLPDDYLEQQSMTWDSDFSKKVHYRPIEEFNTLIGNGDVPTVFTIDDNQIRLLPLATGKADFVYYAKYANLENDNDTNWLLINAPSIYLKGSLIEAYGFTRNQLAQASALADYVSAANGLSMQTRKALQPARLSPTIPGVDFIGRRHG